MEFMYFLPLNPFPSDSKAFLVQFVFCSSECCTFLAALLGELCQKQKVSSRMSILVKTIQLIIGL